MIIIKEYLKQINPNQDKNIYNAKYSEGTYRWLNKYKKKDIKIYWNKRSPVDGKITEFDFKNVAAYPTQIIFCYEEFGDLFGTQWNTIMRNSYKVVDYCLWKDNFEDITDVFLKEYLKIGRCLFDKEHINFVLGKDHAYVKDEERFEYINGIKKCKWCGKVIK